MTADRLLSDAEFYRAVACAAPPGGPARKPFLRWNEAARGDVDRRPRLGHARLPGAAHARFRRGLDAAVAQVNALDAGIRLRAVAGGPADIAVHVVATTPGHVMHDTGVAGPRREPLALGRVALRVRDGEIRDALIAVSAYADRPRSRRSCSKRSCRRSG